MAIPAKLEELILEGKARFETYQCAYTEANVIPVESKEFIVITSFTFLPANFVAYVAGSERATIQRIEFFSGNTYNHFIYKTGGQGAATDVDQEPFNQETDLYMVHHNDVGIMVTVPKLTNRDWSANFEVLDGSNGNAARKVVNQGTNPYTATPQTVLGRTRGFSAGTDNVPFNRKPNAQDYSGSFNGGPVPGGSTNQFNFTAEDNVVYYRNTKSYAALTPEALRQGWYLNVQYVRVFNSGTNVR